MKKITLKSSILYNYFLLLCFIFVISSCSVTSSNRSSAGFEADMSKEGHSAYLDEDTKSRSDAIYYYLRGQLALNDENLDLARNFFIEAGKISDGSDLALRRELSLLHLERDKPELALEESSKLLLQERNASNLMFHIGVLLALKKHDEALESLTDAIGEFPKAEVYLLGAAAAHAAGDSLKAAEFLSKGNRKFKKNGLIKYFLANLLNEQNRYAEALKYRRQALSSEDDNRSFKIAYLRDLLLNKQYKKAGQEIDDLSTIWTGQAGGIILSTIGGLLKDGNTKQALTLLEGFLGKEAIEVPEIIRHLAVQSIENRNFENGVRYFRLLLIMEPEDDKARYYLASSYAAIGQKNRAVSELLKIRDDAELFVESRTFAAFLMRQMSDLAQAEETIRAAISGSSNIDINLHFFLIDLLKAQGDYQGAKDVMEDVLEHSPRNERALFNYASILDELGDEDEAISAMKELLKLNPRHSQALNYLAYRLAIEETELDRALVYVNQALEQYPEDGYFLDTKGFILVKQGKIDEAIDILGKAVNLTGDDLVVMNHFAESLLKGGNKEKALRYYLAVYKNREDAVTREEKEVVSQAVEKISWVLEKYPHLKKIAHGVGFKK